MKIINGHNMEIKHWKEVVSNDSMRPVMTGVYFDLINHCMVGTNSHLLLECPIDIEFTEEEKIMQKDKLAELMQQQSKIVPIEFFDKRKYMGNWKDYWNPEITYDLSDDNYAHVLNNGEVVFRCRYIDGKFPNYKAVYPKGQTAIDSIGIDISMAQRVYKAIPFPNPYKALHFKFFAKNRGIVFHNTTEKRFKGIIMPNIGD
jgi:DNA polymerase III sliding clamp (beta) subunit (PCNA family)